MTGYRSSHFRHKCSESDCYIEQLPSWDDIIECFPRKIRPTDVDGFVEINGQFLFMEEKRAGIAPEEGQRKALLKLSRTPGFTVVFFRPGGQDDLEVLIFGAEEPQGWQPMNRPTFLKWLRGWADAADRGEQANGP